MQKKIILFYPKKDVMDMRVTRLEEAAKQADLLVEKICIHDILFTENGIFYNNKKICFSPNNIHWVVSFPTVSRNLSFILKLENIILYPLLHDIAYDLDDKYSAHCFFAKYDIPTLHTTLLEPRSMQSSIKKLNDFPLIIKTTLGSAGTGVAIVNNEQEIHAFMKEQLTFGKKTFTKKLSFILQEYIKENNGEDYRVLCIGTEVLGIIKRTAQEGFKSNVSLGGNVQHIKNHPELEKMAKKIMRESGLFMAGIDFIQTNRGFLAIEINASPQFEGFERAININVSNHIIHNLLHP
ncbi:MAG: RimK family alpha-L-glutamate ligase [Patescibacteria group bacterium]|nr:RimK family alpha-L-glutamate ligase [Patescibacteria group bacterium]